MFSTCISIMTIERGIRRNIISSLVNWLLKRNENKTTLIWLKNIGFPSNFNLQCVRIPNTPFFLLNRIVDKYRKILILISNEGKHGTKNLLIQAIILCSLNFPECFLGSVEANLLSVFFSQGSSSYNQKYSSITLQADFQIHVDSDRRVGLNAADGLRQSDFLAIKITVIDSRIATHDTTINDIPIVSQRLKSRRKNTN